MRNQKKKLLVLLAVALLVSPFFMNANVTEAKKKPQMLTTYVELFKGDTETIKVKNATKKVKWSSTKSSVVSAKSTGKASAKITGKKAGKATIKAKVNGKTLKCVVKVLRLDDDDDSSSSSNTSQREIENAILINNYNILKNYILTNGETNVNGSKYISFTFNDYTGGIVYDSNLQLFKFLLVEDGYLSDGSPVESALALKVYESNLRHGDATYIVIVSDESAEGTWEGSLTDIMYDDNDLNWKTVSGAVSVKSVANSVLDLGMRMWANALEDYAPTIQLKHLGFNV